MEYIKTVLGQEAIDYTIEKIGRFKALSTAVLELHDLNAGSIYSYLPEDMKKEYINNFIGGMGPDQEISFDILERLVHRFLSEEKSHVVIMEDSCARRTDPCVTEFKSNLAFHNDEVYHFLLHEHRSTDTVSTGLSYGTSAWRNVGFMTSLPPEIHLQKMQQLDKDTIHVLAKNVEALFIDAYDLDGYLIWERAR